MNDNVDAGGPTDQFQPSVAAGPGGAVAVAFYDRRAPARAIRASCRHDVGRTNFCIDVSLQAYKDSGAGAVPVGGNVRVSQFTWDPEQPAADASAASAVRRAPATPTLPDRRGFIGDYFGLAISGRTSTPSASRRTTRRA